MDIMHLQHILKPVYIKESTILILGSFPSIKSRENDFYYMNKYNRFWSVLSHIYNQDFINMNKEEKIQKLNDLKIALYDVIEECDINGSQDQSIRNVVPANIDKIIQETNIKKIFLNGNKAYSLFKKYYPNYLNISYPLPSTSPANAKYSLENLISEWTIINN